MPIYFGMCVDKMAYVDKKSYYSKKFYKIFFSVLPFFALSCEFSPRVCHRINIPNSPAKFVIICSIHCAYELILITINLGLFILTLTGDITADHRRRD